MSQQFHAEINKLMAPLLKGLRRIRAHALRCEKAGIKVTPAWLEKVTREALDEYR